MPGPRGRPRGRAGVRPGRRRLGLWPKCSARGAEPRRWPTTCGSPARSPGNPPTRRGCSSEFPEIQRVPTPRAPAPARNQSPEVEVYEWLDRPMSSSLDQATLDRRSAADRAGERLHQPPFAAALEPRVREPRANRGGPVSAARELAPVDPSGSVAAAAAVPRRRCLDFS